MDSEQTLNFAQTFLNAQLNFIASLEITILFQNPDLDFFWGLLNNSCWMRAELTGPINELLLGVVGPYILVVCSKSAKRLMVKIINFPVISISMSLYITNANLILGFLTIFSVKKIKILPKKRLHSKFNYLNA
ncbi:hypothetical protein BpHYR1_054348 [Brachionus plicatilis]|uniref:Uncharacterized protein n=1 Tax=Brachionus plicatilis TaxID=10195 RepID=A0A3M7RE84_BRAPC|nr:hypothetical protein BpHYR1_054348 [Brachionus plicatilis]